MGHDQAGLAELIQFVLAQFPAETAHTLANNMFLTRGLANLRCLQPRLEAELMIMTIQVDIQGDPSRGPQSGCEARCHQCGHGGQLPADVPQQAEVLGVCSNFPER